MRPLRIVLAEGTPGTHTEGAALAERAGFEIVGEAVEWDRVAELASSRAADIVLIVGDADYARASSILGGAPASIVFAPDPGTAKEYADCGVAAVVTREFDPEVLRVIAELAVSRTAELVAARSEAQELRDQLESRKVVERAKGVLMRRLGIPEEAAYRRMQKASQDENKKLRQIAESILSAEKLLDDGSAAERV